ncbi:hypothetical protein ScPMuIL_012104 [Solemya velum]
MITAGADHSMALTMEGRVFVWGGGSEGQLGLGEMQEAPEPTELIMDEDIISIASCVPPGEGCSSGLWWLAHSGSHKGGKRLHFRGRGQCPARAWNHSTGDIHTRTHQAQHDSQQDCLWENHTALVTRKGQLMTFGDGRHGKLALGSEGYSNQFTPAKVPRFSKFKINEVSCGGCHMVVLATLKIENGYIESSESEEEDVLSKTKLSLNHSIKTDNSLDLSVSARERRRQHSSPMPQHRTLPELANSKPLPLLHSTLPRSLDQSPLKPIHGRLTLKITDTPPNKEKEDSESEETKDSENEEKKDSESEEKKDTEREEEVNEDKIESITQKENNMLQSEMPKEQIKPFGKEDWESSEEEDSRGEEEEEETNKRKLPVPPPRKTKSAEDKEKKELTAEDEESEKKKEKKKNFLSNLVTSPKNEQCKYSILFWQKPRQTYLVKQMEACQTKMMLMTSEDDDVEEEVKVKEEKVKEKKDEDDGEKDDTDKKGKKDKKDKKDKKKIRRMIKMTRKAIIPLFIVIFSHEDKKDKKKKKKSKEDGEESAEEENDEKKEDEKKEKTKEKKDKKKEKDDKKKKEKEGKKKNKKDDKKDDETKDEEKDDEMKETKKDEKKEEKEEKKEKPKSTKKSRTCTIL